MFAATAVAWSAAACTGEPTGSDLDTFLCSADDLGWAAHEVARGEFGEEGFERGKPAGFDGGRFVFFSQALTRPPFDPPLQVVCQVLEFESAGASQHWAASLSAETLAVSSEITAIPSEHRDIREIDNGDFPAEGSVLRHFELTAGEGAERVSALVETANLGRLGLIRFVASNEDRLTRRHALAQGALGTAWAERLKNEPVPR